MKEEQSIEKTEKTTGLAAPVERLVMCDCHPENYTPHMVMTGWECKKCGEVKEKNNFSDCDSCPCKYEKEVYVTGYTTSGHTGELISISIQQNGKVERFERVLS